MGFLRLFTSAGYSTCRRYAENAGEFFACTGLPECCARREARGSRAIAWPLVSLELLNQDAHASCASRLVLMCQRRSRCFHGHSRSH